MTTQGIEFATHEPRIDVAACDQQPRVATALICDNALLRNGLQYILSGTSFVVTEVASLNAGGDRVGRESAALVVIEASQRSPKHVSEMIRRTKALFPEARIVALAEHLDLGLMQFALDAGVNGFCLTASSREALVTSLELVMLGETVLPSAMVRSLLDGLARELLPEPGADQRIEAASGPRAARLTPRESEVLNCLRVGASNKIIARELDLNEATVKVHVKAILRKIGVQNRTQAAMWAVTREGAPARAG